MQVVASVLCWTKTS